MTVYIIWRELRDGFGDIWGIYSTPELAESRLQTILSMACCPRSDDMQIIEHELDKEREN